MLPRNVVATILFIILWSSIVYVFIADVEVLVLFKLLITLVANRLSPERVSSYRSESNKSFARSGGSVSLSMCRTQNRSGRAREALGAALLADRLASTGHGNFSLEAVSLLIGHKYAVNLSFEGDASTMLRSAKALGHRTECGEELAQSLSVISQSGFEMYAYAIDWHNWVRHIQGSLPAGIMEARLNALAGAPLELAGSHYVDFSGAVRAPALLLLVDHVDDEDLVGAAMDAVSISHENPKVLQAVGFFMRAALHLLSAQSCQTSTGDRRSSMIAALRVAADRAGAHFHSLIDAVFSEAQRRDALEQLGFGPTSALENVLSDVEVLGRLTASGHMLGDEIQSGKASFIVPAILWLAVGYADLPAAALANALLGGDSGARAIFIGLLVAARDGLDILEEEPSSTLMTLRLPSFLSPIKSLVGRGSHCKIASSGELRMHRVGVSAAVKPLHVGYRGPSSRLYRIYVRLDAQELFASSAEFDSSAGTHQPVDWDESEDGVWEVDMPQHGAALCKARFFQFTCSSGRHTSLSLWPEAAMCNLTRDSPAAFESFDVDLPDPLTFMIGGLMLEFGSEIWMLKLPRLQTRTGRPHKCVEERFVEEPSWAPRCTHIGYVKLPEGTWTLAD